MLDTLARQIISGDSHGFTVATMAVRPDGPVLYRTVVSGYAVGGNPECPERRIDNVETVRPEDLHRALNEYAAATRRAGAVMGGWVHEGDLYLDAPVIVADRDLAVALGSRRGELAVFDLTTGREVMLAPASA